jgi:hypothetical protein
MHREWRPASPLRAAVLCCAGLLATAAAQPPPAGAARAVRAGAIDPRGVAALERMTAFLKTVERFKASTEATTDEVVDFDMKVQRRTASEVTVRRPNGLNAHTTGDGRDLRFVYDGTTFTLYSAVGNYYAAAPAPPTLARTLDAIRARYGVVFPLADFIYMAAAESLMEGVKAVGYMGSSVVDGTACDHVAVRQGDVDWQVWIEQGDTPLPRKYVITTRTQAVRPQFEARIRWDLSPQVDQGLFTFTPPAGATRIAFARIAPQRAPIVPAAARGR